MSLPAPLPLSGRRGGAACRHLIGIRLFSAMPVDLSNITAHSTPLCPTSNTFRPTFLRLFSTFNLSTCIFAGGASARAPCHAACLTTISTDRRVALKCRRSHTKGREKKAEDPGANWRYTSPNRPNAGPKADFAHLPGTCDRTLHHPSQPPEERPWGGVGGRGGAKWDAAVERSGQYGGAGWDAAAERYRSPQRSLVAHEKRPPHGEGARWRVMPE